jgi:hypothetical protein
MEYKTELTQQQMAVVAALQYGGISSITIQCVDALIADFTDLEKIRVRELIGDHPMPQTLFYNYTGQYWIDHSTFESPGPETIAAVKFAKSLPDLGPKVHG